MIQFHYVLREKPGEGNGIIGVRALIGASKTLSIKRPHAEGDDSPSEGIPLILSLCPNNPLAFIYIRGWTGEWTERSTESAKCRPEKYNTTTQGITFEQALAASENPAPSFLPLSLCPDSRQVSRPKPCAV